MIFALTSQESEVQFQKVDETCDEFTAFNIWCAGLSCFPSIGKDLASYQVLLDCSVTIRNHAYQKLFSFVVTHPSSLLPLPSPRVCDRHVVKLRISTNNWHVVKLHNT
jgi:hypothetical protein